MPKRDRSGFICIGAGRRFCRRFCFCHFNNFPFQENKFPSAMKNLQKHLHQLQTEIARINQ